MKNMLFKKRVGVLAVLFLMLSQFAFSQEAPEDLSGENLKSWLITNYYDGKHQTLGYTTARKYLYNYIDNEDNVITGVYSGYEVNSTYGGTTTYPAPINCEHTIPQSFFNEANPMVSDLHHLYPAYENWNSTRSNYPFAEIDDSETEKWMCLDQSQTTIPTSNIDLYSEYANSTFEPREDHKGNVARSIFYFYTMYPTQAGDISKIGDIDVFYQWHLDDPVDAAEIERNGQIETYQGDRNPYIDYPELVARAWGFSTEETTPSTPSLQINASETSITLSWADVSSENGYQLYKSTDGSTYSLLSNLTANTTSYTDNSVLEDITYYYYILAYNDYGNSSNSSTVSGELSSENTGTGISVSEALAESTGTDITVDGIITESYNGIYALVMQDVNGTETIVVKLELDQRDEWNPENNQDAVGKTIEVVGVRDTYSSQESIEYVTSITEIGGTTEDTETPTAPTSLASASITETSFTLNWTTSTDNVAVTGYNIYQGGSLLATTSSTSYGITGLSASTTYSYYVTAKDAAGNVSDASSTLSVTTNDAGGEYCDSEGSNYSYEWISEVTIDTYTNSSSAAGYTDFTSEIITLDAGTSVDVSLTPGFAGSTYSEYWKIWIDYDQDYEFSDDELVFDAGAKSKTTVTGTMDILSTATGTTRMRVSMKYNAEQTACETFSYGEVEDYTVSFEEAVPDNEAPTTPTSLVASSVTSSSVTLSWTASTDNVAISQYNVYQNGSLVETSTTNNYTATGLSSSTSYSFYVTAEDVAGNVSGASSTVTATTSDEELTYCSSAGNTVNYEWIDLVQFNEIDNTTSNSEGGYSDYTSLTANVALGSNQTIYFSCGFYSSSYTEYWHVWIDWDHSGTFDSDEEMVTRSSSSDETLSSDFTVPSNATLGATRMRVTMKYNSEATACEAFSYGEVEDYTIIVTSTKSAKLLSESAIVLNVKIKTKVYPNPANNFTTLELIADDDIEVSYRIVDIQGRIHIIKENIQVNGYQEEKIDISKLESGIYFIMISNDNINESYKLLVK